MNLREIFFSFPQIHYTTNEPLPLSEEENTTPLLSLLPSLTDNSQTRSLQLPLTQLLKGDRYTHLLTGLMAVTGLKASELLKSKKFSPHPDEAFALLLALLNKQWFRQLQVLS